MRNLTLANDEAAATAVVDSRYIIKGGEQGRSRLAVISRVLAPTTRSLLNRFEPLHSMVVVDAGCGGGDVAFELAGRVGPHGRVIGLDLDEAKLALARDEASRSGIGNVEFKKADMMVSWPVDGVDLVYMRFLLTHVARPAELLRRAHDALRPGGVVIVEDIDYGGQFCDPPSAAVDLYCDVYVRTALHHRGDPFVGRSLVPLLQGAHFTCRFMPGAAVRTSGRHQASRAADVVSDWRRGSGVRYSFGGSTGALDRRTPGVCRS